MVKSKKVFLVSLGCSKNHCDLENMAATLIEGGYDITLSEEEAGIAIINTCGFIEEAKKEAIDEIFKTVRMKEEGIVHTIIVTGCLAQRYGREIIDEIPEVDAVVGVFDFDKITDVIQSLSNQKSLVLTNTTSISSDLKKLQLTPFYTAYLKISEGCDNRCAYCAIPGIRGPYQSRSLSSLASEAEELAQNGVKELIVVAQDVTRYGIDFSGEPQLINLLEKLSGISGIEWIRLHYLYPEMVTDPLIEYIRHSERVIPYFDIPIQHINDRILRLMNRRSDRRTIERLIDNIRSKIPRSVIRTTVMTGFPTETEPEFEELCSFLEEAKFDRLGCFAFSKEEGTLAYSMKGHIAKREKLRRQKRIMAIQKDIMEEKNRDEIGKIYTVLTEGYHSGHGVYFGRTYKDSVDIDGMVMFDTKHEIEFGDMVRVKITGAMQYDLIGEMI